MARHYDLTKLIGTEIREKTFVTSNKGITIHKWTVIEAYPCFVKCMRITENGTELFNTFNLGELVTMGILSNGRPCEEASDGQSI